MYYHLTRNIFGLELAIIIDFSSPDWYVGAHLEHIHPLDRLIVGHFGSYRRVGFAISAPVYYSEGEIQLRFKKVSVSISLPIIDDILDVYHAIRYRRRGFNL